ncbi:MAG: tRNA lysidine(34) synthetase TilS [Elusimicrobiota bacterium]
MPAPKRLLSHLAVFDRAERLLSSGDRVLIGVSGGPDSVCLAHHLARIAGRRSLNLAVLHINHGLRGKEAVRDALFVEKIAVRLSLPFILDELPVRAFAQQERRSLEDAARFLRYRAFGFWAGKLACNKIAVGHNADDQAETLILHLLRGKKARGLGGIPPKRLLRADSKVKLIRPLMALNRREILAYLKAFGLTYRTDSTNKSEKFTRNWVRRRILPLLEKRNPGVRANLLAIAADVRRLTGRDPRSA